MRYEDAKILESYWHIVAEELEARIHNEEIVLRTCEERHLKETQARIQVYAELKTLPQDMAERLSTRG